MSKSYILSAGSGICQGPEPDNPRSVGFRFFEKVSGIFKKQNKKSESLALSGKQLRLDTRFFWRENGWFWYRNLDPKIMFFPTDAVLSHIVVENSITNRSWGAGVAMSCSDRIPSTQSRFLNIATMILSYFSGRRKLSVSGVRPDPGSGYY